MPPIRPPDRADLNTFRQRNLASQRSTAYDYTNRTFNALRPFFGPHTQMPLIYWGQGTTNRGVPLNARREAAITTRRPGQAQQIRMGLPQLHQLIAAYNDMHRRGANRFWKQGAQSTLLQTQGVLAHELAHSQQGRWGSKLRTEGGADAFASLAFPRIGKALGLYRGFPYNPGYGDLWRKYTQVYGPNQAMFGQFGQRGTFTMPPQRLLPRPVFHKLPPIAQRRVMKGLSGR